MATGSISSRAMPIPGDGSCDIVSSGDGATRALGAGQRVGLAEARRQVDAARRQVRNGEDPITVRQAKRRTHPFLLRDVAKDCFEARKSDLRGDGVAGRWFSPLELHGLPKLGATPIIQINQVAIKDALAHCGATSR